MRQGVAHSSFGSGCSACFSLRFGEKHSPQVLSLPPLPGRRTLPPRSAAPVSQPPSRLSSVPRSGTNPRAPFSKAPSSNKPAHSAADARPQRPTPAPHRPPHSDVQHATKPPVAAPLTLYFPSSRVLPINVVKMPPTPPMPTQPAICACWFLRGGRQAGVRTAVRRDARVRGVRASVRRAAGAARRAPASECETAF